ncbi:hypothetical protein ES703_25584 [subsurface metagenome]
MNGEELYDTSPIEAVLARGVLSSPMVSHLEA